MADIRIKDLTTEAPTSLTGDFLPIDGGTGTRKLSAYSPTFGGNATVGGTLTVSGKIALATGTTSANGVTFGDLDFYRSFSSILSTTAGTLSGGVGAGFFAINSAGSQPLVLSANNVEGARVTATGNVLIGGTTDISGSGGLKVFGTTASTTTSSGALVVGDGTSGGLGVGGAIYAGGSINTTNAITASQTITGNDFVATAGYIEIKGFGGTAGTGVIFLGQSANNNFINGGSNNMTFRLANTTRLTIDATDITIASGTALKLGNAYTAGAPTATGYVVIKDSTGTSYKIPAVAL